MVSNRKSKASKKEGHLKVSAAKLSNKRLNRLAKQGKLKRILGKKRLKTIVGGRLNPGSKQAGNDVTTKAEHDADEIPLEEADYEYYARPGRNVGFLSAVAQRANGENERKARRKRNVDVDGADEDLEGKYAKQRLLTRSNDDDVEVKTLLPTKCKEKGVIRRSVEVKKLSLDSASSNAVGTHWVQTVESIETPLPAAAPMTPAEAYIHRQMLIAEAKEKIASLCSAVVSSPEDNVGKLKELRSFLGDVDPNMPVTVRKLAALSLMEVFKDIIPEYRIRVATDTEKHQKMKKDTKKLFGYEESLVSNYRHYLESLESMATGKPLKDKTYKKTKTIELPEAARKSLCLIAVRCLCELLASHPHFNYRSNVIAVVVPFLAKQNVQLSDMVCEYVRRIFVEDKAGDVTLEVVRLIGRLVKSKKFNVHPKVLGTFLSLKVKEVAKPEDAEKPRKMTRDQRFKQFSKRERKRKKQMSELERELQEAAVEDDTKRHLRLNTEIINTIFLTYFRILKTGRRSPLLSVVLEGLSRFAHLINLSFFDDLFNVMTDLVDGGELTYRESLHCIQTAFTLLTGFGASLNIDPMRFYSHLYRTLFHLHAGNSSVDLPIALQCLDVLIGRRRRQVPPPRVLAFVKRLSTLALQMNCNGSLALLTLIKNIIAEHPKCDALLETDSYGSGEFMPELDEPDLCNAHNTSLYELHLLRKSFHPSVRQYSDFLLKSKDARYQLPPEMARSSPVELFNQYDASSMDFKPELQQRSAVKKQKSSFVVESSTFYKSAMDTVGTVNQTIDKIDFSAECRSLQ